MYVRKTKAEQAQEDKLNNWVVFMAHGVGEDNLYLLAPGQPLRKYALAMLSKEEREMGVKLLDYISVDG